MILDFYFVKKRFPLVQNKQSKHNNKYSWITIALTRNLCEEDFWGDHNGCLSSSEQNAEMSQFRQKRKTFCAKISSDDWLKINKGKKTINKVWFKALFEWCRARLSFKNILRAEVQNVALNFNRRFKNNLENFCDNWTTVRQDWYGIFSGKPHETALSYV